MNKLKILFTFINTSIWMCCLTSQSENEIGMQRNLQELIDPNYSSKSTALNCVSNSILISSYKDVNSKIEHQYFQQTIDGIKVLGAINGMHSIGSNIKMSANRFFVCTQDTRVQDKIEVNWFKALILALDNTQTEYNNRALNNINFAVKDLNVYSIKGLTKNAIDFEIYLIPTDKNILRLAYVFVIESDFNNDVWVIAIDTENGELLEKFNLTIKCKHSNDSEEDCDESEYKSTNHDNHNCQSSSFKENISYMVYPLPLTNQLEGSRSLVPERKDSILSPLGWHIPDKISGEYSTYGNNVHAYHDINKQDSSSFDEPRSDSNYVFDFPLSTNFEHPQENPNPGIVNCFYIANLCHDLFYLYGFDERAGNFQVNNFDRGGKQGDVCLIECPDNLSLDNANASTKADGTPLRIQMFPWFQYEYNDISIRLENDSVIRFESFRLPFGPVASNRNILFNLVLINNASLLCDTPIDSIKDKFVLIQRGGCLISKVIENAYKSGAKGIIIVDFDEDLPKINNFTPAIPIDIPCFVIRKSAYNDLKEIFEEEKYKIHLLEESRERRYFDSGFGNNVIIHEYAHGVSNRLTNPNSFFCLYKDEQMGEGWSDFFALAFTLKHGSNGHEPTGLAWLNTPYYIKNSLGVRRKPYSTDFKINDYTYYDILQNRYEVGEVWCNTLWDLLWIMADKYGYDPDPWNKNSGNGLSLQLVMEAMRLQPCNPGMIDGRNSILQIDSLLFNGKYSCDIWKAFSRRGMGYFAEQGSNELRGDEKPDFTFCPKCTEESALKKYVEALVYRPGDTLTTHINFTNQTGLTKYNVQILDTINQGSHYIIHSANVEPMLHNNILSWTYDSIPAYQSVNIFYDIKLKSSSNSLAILKEPFNPTPNLGNWSNATEKGLVQWDYIKSPHSNSFYIGINEELQFGLESNVTLTLNSPIRLVGDNPCLVLNHSYYMAHKQHGGIIEITVDGKQWKKIPDSLFTVGAYNFELIPDVIEESAYKVFTSKGAKQNLYTEVNLSAFRDKEIQLRFRYISDQSSTNFDSSRMRGWFLDELIIFGNAEYYQSTAVVLENNKQLYEAKIHGNGIILDEIKLTNTYIKYADNSIILYPNPGESEYYLSSDSELDILQIDLYSVIGNSIPIVMHKINNNFYKLNLDNINPGTYILNIMDKNNEIIVKKMTKWK